MAIDTILLDEDDTPQGQIIYGDQAAQAIILSHEFASKYVFPTLNESKVLNKPDPAQLQLQDKNLTVDYATTATITFVESNAGYKNTLGYYKVTQDGTIQSVKIFDTNAKDTKAGTQTTFDVGGDRTELGIFIIADGFSKNGEFKKLDLSVGEISFVYHKGKKDERLAKVSDTAKDVTLVYKLDGKTTEIKGDIYHATENPDHAALNADGKQHAVSGLVKADDPSTLRIGFEDLKGLGDKDYNDVVIDIKFGTVGIPVENPLQDVLIGGAGDDFIYGLEGNDTLYGEGGNDEIVGNEGKDTLYGGDGDDKLNGNNEDDVLYGEGGNDVLNGGTGSDILDGGVGDDNLYGASGHDTITGHDGIDRVYGGAGNDVIDGGTDNDIIFGEEDDDSIIGGLGDDYIDGGAGNDTIDGGEGIDEIYGGSGNNTITAGAGNDFVFGGENVDTITLGEGNDRAEAGAGKDHVDGGAGDDLIYGQAGSDILFGGAGNDTLYGGDDNDILNLGEGLDVLYGEGGSDIFVFQSLDANIDQVRDFTLLGTSKDYLDVSDILTGFTQGVSDIDNFILIKYKNADRADLFVNVDGTGNDWQQAAIIRGSNFSGITAETLVASGQIITDPNIV